MVRRELCEWIMGTQATALFRWTALIQSILRPLKCTEMHQMWMWKCRYSDLGTVGILLPGPRNRNPELVPHGFFCAFVDMFKMCIKTKVVTCLVYQRKVQEEFIACKTPKKIEPHHQHGIDYVFSLNSRCPTCSQAFGGCYILFQGLF